MELWRYKFIAKIGAKKTRLLSKRCSKRINRNSNVDEVILDVICDDRVLKQMEIARNKGIQADNELGQSFMKMSIFNSVKKLKTKGVDTRRHLN